jgi:NADH:ubiquinone oxidoreductase subunit 5 (subunit L)/multisubunit Na+/H+ antiporter MnhA subunit
MISPIVLPLLICALSAGLSVLLAIAPLGRHMPSRWMGWLLAIAPAAAFALLITESPAILAGQSASASIPWMPSLGLNFSLRLDGLSLLFALLVSGIGVLVTIYAGYYFTKPEQNVNEDARFFAYLMLFMTSMLGLVLAGDVIALFVFWEGTSLTSFLLIAYKSKDEEARRGAFKALLVTGAGGIALLAGLLFAAAISGSTDLATILRSGDLLRKHAWYPVMLALLAFGAFTKSAQAPFHFWLPKAMAAPTPASAYLHSATMVKAGVYLLARLHPALGNTEGWFWLMTIVGGTTMLLGALIGLRQSDLKGLLAYSTVSQLGALTMLIGEEASSAFKALAIGILAHALYKGALFMVAGIVDHHAGSRDLRQLGGLWRAMPLTFAICSLVGLSMAGLPPLFGFLAKETLLAAGMEEVLPQPVRTVLPAIIVLTGAGLLAQAASLTLDTFITKPGTGWPASSCCAEHTATSPAHEAPLGMLIGPAVLAVLSLVISVFQPEAIVSLLASAAGAAYGAKVKVSLELFQGITPPLVLSGVAIALGMVLFASRRAIRSPARIEGLDMNLAYEAVLRGVDWAARLATRTQGGRIRVYLSVILIALFALVALFGDLQRVLGADELRLDDALDVTGGLRLLGLLLAVAASFVSIVIRRDLLAIIALGSSGLAIAVVIALEPSPDVALVQAVVDVLTTVVLVLALSRLPRAPAPASRSAQQR